MTWEPILDGELAERAWSAVRELADAMAPIQQPSPDLALFWTYVAAASDDDQTSARTETALTTFARDIERGVPGPMLWGGLSGAGWVANHVADDVEPFLEIVDAALLESLSIERWVYHYDLISGLVGMAVYFLDREGPQASRGLARIVEHLDATSETSEAGVTWHTPPELLPPYQVEHSPDGYYNCGLAHGVPGVISVLGKIACRPDAPAAAARLCDEATRWLLAQRDAVGFPSSINAGYRAPSRDAWCYGAPGAVIAMWSAAVRRGQSTAELDTLHHWMTKPFDKTGVFDTALCHGAVGLAHIANRYYQATGNRAYRDVAIRWYERTLEMRRGDEPFAGFPQYSPIPDAGDAHWKATSALLDGAAGVGLGLLAGLVPIEPEWDRMLLTDLPVRET